MVSVDAEEICESRADEFRKSSEQIEPIGAGALQGVGPSIFLRKDPSRALPPHLVIRESNLQIVSPLPSVINSSPYSPRRYFSPPGPE